MKFIKNKQGFVKVTHIILIVLVSVLIIAGISYAYQLYNRDDNKTAGEEKGQLIGGDTDEGGCLIAAGYSWCEVKNKCLRTWEEPCLTEDTQRLVETYLSENISELSPEKEVLGGKFYITGFRFTEDGKVTVNYEDGHIALEANVSYTVEGNQVSIQDFSIVKDTGSNSEAVIDPAAEELAVNELADLFSQKYNTAREEIVIMISDNRGDYLRGSVKMSLDPEAVGGYFLAKRVEGKFVIVLDGNGEIDCSLVSDFPSDMVSDCAEK